MNGFIQRTRTSLRVRLMTGMAVMLAPLVVLGVGSIVVSQSMLDALDKVVRTEAGELRPVTDLQKLAGIPALFERYSNWYAEFQRALFHDPNRAALVVVSPAAGGETSNSVQTMMGLIMAGQMIFFSFFTGAYSMQSILQESEEGTLARIFTTPTDRTTILAGKFLAVLLTVILQGVALITAGRLLFNVNWGEPGAMAFSFLGQMIASVGLAVLLVSFIKTSKQAGPIFGGGLTMLGMISGLFTTNIQMPAAFNAMGNFTPQGWVLKAWQLTLDGQAAGELVVPCLVLVAMGVVMFAFGAVMFRKRFA